MLLTKEVEITWGCKSKSHYVNKGYNFTKMGDILVVKCTDLMRNSRVYVEVACDNPNCSKKHSSNQMTWMGYMDNIERNNKYLCESCSPRVKAQQESLRIKKLKQGKSFKDWCKENNRDDLLNLWDYEKNTLKPNEISYQSHKHVYFRCERGLHSSEKMQVRSFSLGWRRFICSKCNSIAQWGIDTLGEDFLEKYWDYDKNTDNPWNVSRGSNAKRIWIKCVETDYHGSSFIYPNSITSGETRCSYCGVGSMVHPLDSLGELHPKSQDVWSCKNANTPYSYSPFSTKVVWWKCENKKHREYKREIRNSNQADFRCPSCSRERTESLLQEKVRLHLQSVAERLHSNLRHERGCELSCINPKTNFLLPYDNEIKGKEIKLIIEVHGEQHYKVGYFHNLTAKKVGSTPEKIFKYNEWKDKHKKDYALSQGYDYLEIPYWTDDKDEEWKRLIEDKIKLITSRQIKQKQ